MTQLRVITLQRQPFMTKLSHRLFRPTASPTALTNVHL